MLNYQRVVPMFGAPISRFSLIHGGTPKDHPARLGCSIFFLTIQCDRGSPHDYGKPHMGMGQNLVPLVNPKIAGKWMFIPLKMVLIGIDP